MNYLSHFYFDQLSDDPYYILGIALPDLTKGHNRSWNIHPKPGELETDPNFESILKGWERHLEVDRLFHSSGFFTKNTELIKNELKNIPFKNKEIRPYVLAHILLELLLDSILIRHKKIQISPFYDHLQTVEPQKIIRFISGRGIENADSFQLYYQRFIEINYLSKYENTENLAYALNRICYRIWKIELNENEEQLLRQKISICYELLADNYMPIFDEISEKLTKTA